MFSIFLLTDVFSVRVVLVTSFYSLFSWLTYRFFRDSTLTPAECHFINSHSNSIFERTENVANPTLYFKFVKNNKKGLIITFSFMHTRTASTVKNIHN